MARRKDDLKVSEHEFELLDIMYRFRFASIKLFQRATGASQNATVQQRIDRLMDKGFVDRRYDAKTDKIERRSAAYFLTPRGLSVITSIDETVPGVAKQIVYRNKLVSRQFVDRSMNVLKFALDFEKKTNRPSGFFSPIQLRAFDYFPRPLPDGFLTTSDRRNGECFFIEYCEADKPTFVHVKKIKKYLEYYNSGEWDVTEMNFPTLILVYEGEEVKIAITRKARYLLDSVDFKVQLVKFN